MRCLGYILAKKTTKYIIGNPGFPFSQNQFVLGRCTAVAIGSKLFSFVLFCFDLFSLRLITKKNIRCFHKNVHANSERLVVM